jgi:excisionase family DNA binding protein
LETKIKTKNQMPQSAELLSLKEAAKLTPYSADYLNLLSRKGKLKARKIGRDWLITKSDLFDYLQKQRKQGSMRLEKISNSINLLGS